MVLEFYSGMNDAPVSDQLIQDIIKTDNQIMDFSNYSWQDFPETGRSTGAYILFYLGKTIDHGTHLPGQVD